MAKRTCVYFISLVLLCGTRAYAQDTVTVPLNIRAGFDLAGPVMNLIGSDLTTYGAIGAIDLNERYAAVMGLRYSSFSVSEYGYDYNSKGISLLAGAEYNMIRADLGAGKYFAGIGLRYGLSFYSQEAPRIYYTNSLGTGTSSLPLTSHTGHYLELAPGVRTELFHGVTIGWNVVVRLLLSPGCGKDIKPVWMPGYGDATRRMSRGMEYYVSVAIPYRRIRVIIKPKKEEPEEEGTEPGTETQQSTSPFGGNGRF